MEGSAAQASAVSGEPITEGSSGRSSIADRFETSMLNGLMSVGTVAAKNAASLISADFGHERRVTENSAHDLKLEIDTRSDRCIRETIMHAYPQHGYYSEESVIDDCLSELVWIVDPLDGTVNYYYGLPYFCVSIACYARDETKDGSLVPLIGVVCHPVTGELFRAAAGQGATLNGRYLRVDPEVGLADCVACVGMTARYDGASSSAKMITPLIEGAKKVRSFGATALDMAQIAAGRIGVLVQRGTNIWDLAAGKVIVEEAGGVCITSVLEPGRYRLAASVPGAENELIPMMERATGESWKACGLSL